MKPSCSLRTVIPVFLVWGVFLLGCDRGTLKFIESIQQNSPITQALATSFEKKLNANILDQAFDLEHSTRVVFTAGGQLTSKQLSLISPAAVAALLTQDALSQTSSSKILDSLVGAVLLGNMLMDSLESLPSDKKLSVTAGDLLIDNQRVYHIKKLESRNRGEGFINKLEMVMESADVSSIKMTAYSLADKIRYVTFSIKKSQNETYFIEAQGKLKRSGFVLKFLNYKVKTGTLEVEDSYESKPGLAPLSFITNQLLSGSHISVSNVVDLSQSNDTAVAALLNQILLERINSRLIQQALDWEHSTRFTFTKDKPLSTAQKQLVPLIALMALLGQDSQPLLDNGNTKEISILLAAAVKIMFQQMLAMPTANTSITQGKVTIDGRSDFKFANAEFTKKNGKSSISIEFNMARGGKLTLDITVPSNGTASAEFEIKIPATDRNIKMKANALGITSSLMISRFSHSIGRKHNLVNSLEISKSSGISVDDLIKNYLLAGSLVSVQDIRDLFQREETFTASIEGSQGDFTDLSRFDLGSMRVEFDENTVTFKYHPGEIEFVVMGERNGNLITISPTSIPNSVFSDPVYGDCALVNGDVEGSCLVVSENILDCTFFIQGIVTDSGAEGSCHKVKSDTTVVIPLMLTAQNR